VEGPLFPNPNSIFSDWISLTTNGVLQYNHQTGEVRESDTMVVRGQLPTYEVGSKEFEELAAEDPKPKLAQVRNPKLLPPRPRSPMLTDCYEVQEPTWAKKCDLAACSGK
jgi:hypothetical protein